MKFLIIFHIIFSLYVILILCVSASYSVDVRCEHLLNCDILRGVNLLPGEKIRLTNLQDVNKIQTFNIIDSLNVTSFPGEIFEQLPSLQHVHILHAQLESISRESFRNANNLIQLVLLWNKIKTIEGC